MPFDGEMDQQDGAQGHRPQHAVISEIPQRTPVEVRLGLALLPARYLLRGLFKTLTDSSLPEAMQKILVDPWRNPIFAEPLYQKLQSKLSQVDAHDLFMGKIPDDAYEIAHQLHDSPKAQALLKEFHQILRPWDAKGVAHNMLQYAIADRDKATDLLTLTEESKGRIRGAMAEPLFESLYDHSLGMGSLAMTFAIRKRVRNDIQNLYTEAVGYEMGKPASRVTMEDIFNSDNTIIQSTVHNYRNKFAQRLGISVLPFLRNVPGFRSWQFGEAAIGLWGAMWVFDVWGRQPTNLEMLSDFVNDKLNPKFGISDPIRTADIINLYQRYATKFKPEVAFKSVLSSDIGEGHVWAQSEKIYQRIADLMNDTYSYKHTVRLDEETGLPVNLANFTVPKFIYLMGHDMINPYQPDWSMAYVQMADKYGMDVVRQVRKEQQSGMQLSEILKRYPVDLNPPRTGRNSLSAAPVVVDEPKADVAKAEQVSVPVAANDDEREADVVKAVRMTGKVPVPVPANDPEPHTQVDAASAAKHGTTQHTKTHANLSA